MRYELYAKVMIAFFQYSLPFQKVFTFVVDTIVSLTTMVTQAQIDRDKIPMPYQRLKNDEVAYLENSIMDGGKPQIIGKTSHFSLFRFLKNSVKLK